MQKQRALAVLYGHKYWCSKASSAVPTFPQTRPRSMYTSCPVLASSTASRPAQPTMPEAKRKATEDRTHIDRQSDETSLSGTDDAVAAESEVSFSSTSPNDPEAERSQASKTSQWSNPLAASPANTSMSESTAEVKSGGGFEKDVDGKKRAGVLEEQKRTRSGGNKSAKPGSEKRVFAGSTTGGDKKGVDSERPALVEQGSR